MARWSRPSNDETRDDDHADTTEGPVRIVVPLNIDDEPGAGPVIGADALAEAAPDARGGRRLAAGPVRRVRAAAAAPSSRLLEHATQRERVDVHEWRVGDLVIRDNRGTPHRGRRHDVGERREPRRTTIDDDESAQQAAA